MQKEIGMQKELLHKFLNNQCSSEELQEVIDWIKNDALNIDGESINYQEWNKYAGEEFSSDKVRMDNMLDKIHHKININEAVLTKRTSRLGVIVNRISRVAAIMLLPVIAFLFYTLSQHNFEVHPLANNWNDSMVVEAPIGSKTHFLLSDSTEVFLNHGSKLKYPYRFSKKNREVVLSGEGYFKVAHNPKHPFVVKTRNMNVTALGTEFNVFAYPDEEIAAATLVNGKVAIEKITKSGYKEVLGEMVPGQHVCYNIASNKVSGSHGEIDRFISWREGKLIFKNEPIDQIANRLNRWYNVEIEFTDEKVKDYTYTATFVDETLTQILDLLEIATPIKYEICPREKLKDGTFSKRKITIGLKK